MNKLIITTIVLFCILLDINGQYSQGKETLIAPSPTVAAMVKFGQIPVSYNTGVPSISIPIYMIECGGITLPISLDYHAGGIRVNDIASWVGLGWSLNTGGVINISVQGGSDTSPITNIIPMDDFESTIPYTVAALKSFHNGSDTQPDIYNYQVGPYAGQFIADLGDSNLKVYNTNGAKDIEFSVSHLASKQFSAKDQFGNNYHFQNQSEEVYNNSQYYQYDFVQNKFTQNLSWIYQTVSYTATSLAKVLNANKTDSITLSYDRMYENYNTQMSGSICWGMSSSRTGWTQYINPFYNNGSYTTKLYPDHYSKAERIIITKKVSTITASNGITIKFTTGAVRKDLNPNTQWSPKSLDKIEIYAPNNVLIKRWDFVYNYFTSYIINTEDDATNYRLKLIGLKEYGSDLQNPKIYTFGYYGDTAGEPQLPYRNSFSGQDYWGFCNRLVSAADAKSFKKSFPNITTQNFTQLYGYYNILLLNYFPSFNYNQVASYSEGENKTPNENYLSACSLKEIIYPTGGRTVFEYESNRYNHISSVQGDYIPSVNEPGSGQRIKKMTDHPLSGAAVVTEYQYNDANGNTSGEIANCPRPIRQKVWQESGIPTSCKASAKDAFEQSYMELKSDCYSSLYTSIGSGLTYSTVAEIKDDGKTIYNFYKRYDHGDYGELNFYEEYENIWGVADNPAYITMRTDNLEEMNVYMRRDNPMQTEDQGFWGTFYKHGTLKNKEIYNKANKIVFKEIYTHKDVYQKKITGLKVYQDPNITASALTACLLNEPHYYGAIMPSAAYFHNTYCILVGLCRLTGKTTTQYDANGNNPVVSKEEYSYNDDNLLTETKITNSSNDIITNTYRYPSEINTGVYSTMKQRNMLNYPIEIIQKKNNAVVSSILNTYKQVSQSANFNMLLQEKVYQAELTAASTSFPPYSGTQIGSHYRTPNLEYLTYNTRGNISMVKDLSEIATTYLWSYNHQYPIAEIKGATYSEVTGKIAETTLNTIAAKNEPTTSDFTTINNLRTQLPNAQVTTYTYKPLVGMQTMTDPRGVVTKYDYDNFGRLNKVTKADNVIETYNYNYKN